MSENLRRRIQERLETLGINPFEAERRAHLKRGYINDLLIGKKTTFREKALPALADALECDIEYLTGSAPSPVRTAATIEDGMRLSGIAEAGAWRDPTMESIPDTPLPILPDPRYSPDELELYLVRGDHAARLGITDGSVVCVLTSTKTIRERDIVLVRVPAGNGTFETSIRVVSGGALSARPASGMVIPALSLNEVEVIGLVISAIRVFGDAH